MWRWDERRSKNPIRLEFSKFLGDDPRICLDRAQQYCVAQDVHGSKKVSLASFYLDGVGLFMQIKRSKLCGKCSRRDCCCGLDLLSMKMQDCKFHQMSSFRELLGEFRKLMNCLPSWLESALMGVFMTGLRGIGRRYLLA